MNATLSLVYVSVADVLTRLDHTRASVILVLDAILRLTSVKVSLPSTSVLLISQICARNFIIDERLLFRASASWHKVNNENNQLKSNC